MVGRPGILMLCPYVPEPLEHGGRIRSRLFADTLGEIADVVLAVPVRPGGSLDTPEHVEALARKFAGRVLPLPVEEAPASGVGRKLRTWLRGRSDLLERRWGTQARDLVARELASGSFAAVFADSSFVLPLLPPNDPTPWILNLHNVESHLLRRRDDVDRGLVESATRRIEAAWLTRTERAAARRARLTLAISPLDAERLRAIEPRASRIEILENSVDAAQIEPLPWTPFEGNAPRLLYVGGYDYGPNREAAETLVRDHLPELRREWPEVRVRLVGRDPEGIVAALAAGDPGVEAIGHVPDLRASYADATAVYLPIRTGGGTRGKILEAFAFGRPVIASTLGAEGFDLRPGREFLLADSPADGVQAVRALENGEVGTGVVENAREFLLTRHTHEVIAARLRALVQAELDRPIGPN